MQVDSHIYDIIAKLLMGSLSKEDSQELDAWLEESPRNKALLDNFLARTDMPQMFDIPAEHEDAETLFNDGIIPLKRRFNPLRLFHSSIETRLVMPAVIAAVALLAVAVVWWNKHTEVIAPELPQEYLAAMTESQKAGRNDADITIADATNQNHAKQLITLADITTESGLDKIIESVQEKADVDEENLQAQVVTHHDKEYWLKLPDGTRVHLNYGCSLTYPLAFTGDTREVTLEGEAYFFVAKDRRHPFIVHTKYGDVKEYGTEFNVNTNAPLRNSRDMNITKASGVSVVLVNGSISVTPRRGHEKMMHPNEMALMNGTASTPEIKKVDVAPFIAWNTGSFSFDDCKLDQLMMVIGKWYNLNVRFANREDEQQRFTGELDRYSDINSAINAINNVTGCSIVIEGKTMIVK